MMDDVKVLRTFKEWMIYVLEKMENDPLFGDIQCGTGNETINGLLSHPELDSQKLITLDQFINVMYDIQFEVDVKGCWETGETPLTPEKIREVLKTLRDEFKFRRITLE